jgi:hypothetical protein
MLVAAGTLLSSGVLAPVFEALPLFKSLHVNPRWNAFVLLPFFSLALAAAGSLEPRRLALAGWQLAVLWAVLFAVPLAFIDEVNMQITYPDRNGIDFARHRLLFCYEPLFGYRLETFPLGQNVNWAAEALVDPRCYLKSSQCRPGTVFGEPGTNAADYALLASYALRDEYPPVKRFKWIALVVYGTGFGCALAWLGQAALHLLRESEPAATRSPPTVNPRRRPRDARA